MTSGNGALHKRFWDQNAVINATTIIQWQRIAQLA
jgi:hypothetical protein